MKRKRKRRELPYPVRMAEASVFSGQEEGLDRQHGETQAGGGWAGTPKRPIKCACARGFIENAWGLCKTCGGTKP